MKLQRNLSAQLTSFIGREAELADVRALVGSSRLVTLIGAGGVGKTRLGLQVAGELLDGDAGEGVWFADLAALGDPGLVATTVAGALGVHQEPGRPALATLVEEVGERRLLVVLDNCEHLIGECAKLADALLRNCPNCRVLATSREPLAVGGERLYRVPSMSLPADDDGLSAIRASEAVRLLADRAASHGVPLSADGSAARVAGRICRRLDGIPLALELAAARLRVMPAEELESRLDDRFALLTTGSRVAPARQQTLRAMVDWSWELLTPAERAVLARLSVFAGGFGMAAAESVAADRDVPAAEVLGHLAALVDKCLVQFGDAGGAPARYRLLETVRQYAAGKLDALGVQAADTARAAHLGYYVTLAEAAAPQLIGTGQVVWMDRLDAELGNLRAAIAFSLTRSDAEPGLRLTSLLRYFWQLRGHAAEAADALQALLRVPAVEGASASRTRALYAVANLLQETGGYVLAEGYADEGLAIARAGGDDYAVAELLQIRAWPLMRQGQPDAALALIEEGLGLARRLGEPHLTACMLAGRCFALNVAEDQAGAARDAREAMRLFRQSGDRLQAGLTLSSLGTYELSMGDLGAARLHLAEAREVARTVRARDVLVKCTFNLALAEYLLESFAAAGELFAESFDLARRMGFDSLTAYPLIGLALSGRGRAEPRWSARLHGAADQAFADLGESIEPLEGRLAEADRRRLRAVLGDEAFEAKYAIGRTFDSGRVLAEVRRAGAAAEQERAAATEAAPSDPARRVLTRRELEVLALVAQGLSNPEIARRLVLSEHTIHRHLANILRKLDLPTRSAAAAWGVRTGLV